MNPSSMRIGLTYDLRDAYLQRRRNLIYDGNPPRERLGSAGRHRAQGRCRCGVAKRPRTRATRRRKSLVG